MGKRVLSSKTIRMCAYIAARARELGPRAEVVATSNGREASAQLDLLGFDLLLTDLNMPERTASSWSDRPRALPALPIVPMSGASAEWRPSSSAKDRRPPMLTNRSRSPSRRARPHLGV
jgi:CheY-like chemotaxis protein